MTNDHHRLIAIDWMRGLVMVLMALDHTSMIYNPGRLALDSAATYAPGTPLPEAQFFTRWITHLCAPTFVFLAGTVMALSYRQRVARGQSEGSIDRDLIIRGLIIAAYDLVLGPLITGEKVVLQVMFAIGTSMVAMAWLRRLSANALLAAGVLWFLAGEVLTALVWDPAGGNPPLVLAVLMAVYRSENLIVIYPVLPWLTVMMLGWAFGGYLAVAIQTPGRSPERSVLILGVTLLFVFIAVRYLNGYGNLFLLREDFSWVQWLHVSKYPPSLSFVTLELGLMCLFLGVFMVIGKRVSPWSDNPFLVFGQTALFFYFIHIPVLVLPGVTFDLFDAGSLAWAYGGAALGLVVLYPLCRWYRGYKSKRAGSWVRYV
jgi:uncharacterized membrane protein